MKERSENLIERKRSDDAIMDFVSRQAQEAILDPNLPEHYKDYVLDAAIRTLLVIAEKRSTYNVRSESKTIYKASENKDGK